MIKPQPLGLDHVPQIKMTPAFVGVEPLVGRRDGADAEAGVLQAVARVEAEEPVGRQSHPERMIPDGLGQGEDRTRRGRHEVGQGPGIEVVGMLVAGQDQVHAAQLAAADRCPRHANVRPVRCLIFLRQVFREIEVDREQAGSAT